MSESISSGKVQHLKLLYVFFISLYLKLLSDVFYFLFFFLESEIVLDLY